MKLTIVVVVVLSFVTINTATPGIGLGDIITGVVEKGKEVVTKLPDLIPTPETIFRSSKEVLLGYPAEYVAMGINKFCSVALSANITQPRVTPDIKNMKVFFYFGNGENMTYPLLSLDQILTHPSFNKEWNTVIFITGWLTDLTQPVFLTIRTMRDAYMARGKTNFIVLDSAGYLNTLYSWAAFNTEAIGDEFGKSIAKMTKNYSYDKIHVIGHSLGSHISSSTGQSFYRETGKLLKRITGLDPANPCFNEGESLSGLQRGDAEFVDVIHTNSDVLGKREPIGDVDFYPNGVVSTQPGCVLIDCAHARSWHYYAETVYNGNENNFLARKCNSLRALNTGRCPGKNIPMGYATPMNTKGNYFMSTGSAMPFGRGLGGLSLN
jgi:lipoprotein lipase